MRAKDLKAYILIMAFLMVCFIGCFVLYEVGVSSISTENAEAQAKAYFNAQEASINEAISEYRVKFAEGSSEVTIVATYSMDFENGKIALPTEMEGVPSDSYAVYFNDGAKAGRVSLGDVLDSAAKGSKNPIIIANKDGLLAGASVAYKVSTLSEVIGFSNNDSTTAAVLAGLTNENGACKRIRLQNSEKIDKGYVVVNKLTDDLSLVTFLSNSEIKLNTENVNKLRLACIAGLLIITILEAIAIVKMIKKVNNSGGIGTGINARTSNIVLVCRSNGKIVKYNKAFKVAFPNHEIPIKSLAELEIIEGQNLVDCIKGQKSMILCHTPEVNEEGVQPDKIYFELLSIKRTGDYSLVGKVITDEYNNEQILINSSTKSAVTGDNNGLILDRRYREVKAKFKAVGDPYCMMIINLRGFKNINALLGFKAGNEVLSYFSERLHKDYEEFEIFHIGADEFVIMSDTNKEKIMIDITDKLLDSLKAPIMINNNEIMLRPAVGILDSVMDGNKDGNYETLIEKLRIACDKAKHAAGKPISKYDTNLENAALKDREMEEDLKQAIARNEFVMFYQPQYEINQERICGFEALLRWNNPKYASISPQVYIELAEKNGFIIDVGNFITRDVLKTAKEMEQYDIHISVNVSPAQIVQAGFVADLLDEFEKNDLQPGAIALEVTETFLMENYSSVIEKLTLLKNRGISIHLDDFGTGYSSMLYLKELPIDTIKVDKEFIKHIETDRFSKVLTSKIISIAKELGDKVICEGVETKVQRDIVGKFGADIIQGYYIGKALSKEDAFALLKTGKVSKENRTNEIEEIARPVEKPQNNDGIIIDTTPIAQDDDRKEGEE